MSSRANEVEPARVGSPHDEWPALLATLLEDFTRVLQSEVKLLRASIDSALKTAVVRAVSQLVLVVIALYGLLCLIGAAVVFLHEWIEWWQALGLTGVALVLVAIFGFLRPRAPSENQMAG